LREPMTWVYAGALTILIVGLAKAWMRFKAKCTEKCATKEEAGENK
jgi:hypothetical protein